MARVTPLEKLGLPDPIGRLFYELLRRTFKVQETKKEEEELPPEFKPVAKKYGKKNALAAYKYLENYTKTFKKSKEW